MDGNFIWTPQADGDGGDAENIVLQNGKYIVDVNGQLSLGGVNHLTFTTNNGNKFGPYGRGTVGLLGKSIPFRVRGGTIVGFHGTKGIYSGNLSFIGFYVSPIETSSHFTQSDSSRMTSKFTEIIGEVGPFGYPRGRLPFDHKGYDGIKTILIGCGRVVETLEVLYEKDGKLIWTPQIGGKAGTIKEIDLEDGEHITNIEGYYGRSLGSATINSLTFFTNRRNDLGPFGFDDGTEPPNEVEENPIPLEVGGERL